MTCSTQVCLQMQHGKLTKKLSFIPKSWDSPFPYPSQQRWKAKNKATALNKCVCATFTLSRPRMQRVRVHPVPREPKWKQTWLITPGGELLQRRDLLTGSRRLGLSGRQRRAGEDARAARWLEAEGVRGGGWGCGRRGRPARATQVSVVKLPEELLVLHRQPLVDLWLLLERFLQHGLFRWQLSVTQTAQQVSTENTCSPRCSTDLRKTWFIRPARGKQRSSALTKTHFTAFNTNGSSQKHQRCSLEQRLSEMKTCGTFIVLLLCVNPSLTTCDYVSDSVKAPSVTEFIVETEHFGVERTCAAVISWMRWKQLEKGSEGRFKLWFP